MVNLLTLILRKYRWKSLVLTFIKLLMISCLGLVSINIIDIVLNEKSYVTVHESLKECNKSIRYLTSSHVTQIRDVILHPELVVGIRKGGEAITDVEDQSEKEEYFTFKYGFLNVSCSGDFPHKTYFANIQKQHHIEEVSTFQVTDAIAISKYGHVVQGHESYIGSLTVGIRRKDYANLYWTLIELYSAYMSAREMSKSSRETTILIMDAHPEGHLDSLWNITFKNVMRVGWVNTPTHFEEFALVPSLKLVPIVRKTLPVPYMDDFRYDVSYEAGGFPSRRVNCKQLRITLVLRKNYVAHPRNKEGKIKRQLENANEIMRALRDTYPTDMIREVAFETLSVREQVKLSTDTDILVGVHGAGLAHTLFQVPGAGLIELFPYEYKKYKNPHFEQLATWSGKKYISWFSDKSSVLLYVPPNNLTKLVEHMRQKICN